jgi:glycosyltransferase involved in cell wall biosynthesis
MISPNVSVIIPCYKMGHYVGEALASVGSQTYLDWEIIVVDDAGPEDGTRQAVADFAKRFPDHRVEYLRHQLNRGVSAARNTAIRAAKGEFLAFLDPDDLWLPEKLLKQLRTFESDTNTVISYSKARISRSGAGINFEPGVEITGAPPENETPRAILGVASGTVMFAFSSLVLKKEILDEVGGFQENLPFQNEDRLMIGSCALFGGMTWVPEPLCIYRMHDGSATTSVIQKEIAYLVEFDLAARLVLWLRRQPHGRRIGFRIAKDVLCMRLKQTLNVPSWCRSRAIIVDLCAQLALSYPSVTGCLILQLMRQCLALAFGRRIASILLRRGARPMVEGAN